MLSVGALIWVSVRPLLRLILCTLCGFIITKADIFPLVAARGAGQILLNITYPALMFSKIVPAFTSANIGALGPLVLVAVTYELLGIVIAWLVKQFFWVPHRFRHGILVAGGWSNVGDVPTAVIMSITGSAPFNPSTDQTLSVAYVAVFILVFFVSLFPMGGHRLVALDFVGPEVDDNDVRMSVAAKAKDSFRRWTRSAARVQQALQPAKKESVADGDSDRDFAQDVEKDPGKAALSGCPQLALRHTARPGLPKHVSFHADDGTTAVPTAHTDAGPSRLASPAPSITHVDEPSPHAAHGTPPSPPHRSPHTVGPLPATVGPSTTTAPRSRAPRHRVLAHARTALRALLTPQALAILLAFPIALVAPLKALFTPVAASPVPHAPDGQPPLAFVLDTASFVAGASVPLGLICLGSALARLSVPRDQWKDLPLGAIGGLAVGKMIVMPILGVLITQSLVHGGLIRADQKVLRFVCIFLSCIPTATTQVFLTQVYSGTGSAEILSAFLIPQYALMFATMTIVSAYTLSLLF